MSGVRKRCSILHPAQAVNKLSRRYSPGPRTRTMLLLRSIHWHGEHTLNLAGFPGRWIARRRLWMRAFCRTAFLPATGKGRGMRVHHLATETRPTQPAALLTCQTAARLIIIAGDCREDARRAATGTLRRLRPAYSAAAAGLEVCRAGAPSSYSPGNPHIIWMTLIHTVRAVAQSSEADRRRLFCQTSQKAHSPHIAPVYRGILCLYERKKGRRTLL